LKHTSKFFSENKDYINKLGLDNDELLKKLRSLTICTVGVETERVSYDALRTKLQVPDVYSVESCVIDAVQCGCVEAKLDESNQEVIISRTTKRSFDVDGWKQLAGQLAAWRKNVSTVLGTLHQIQARAAPMEEKESAAILKL